MKKFEYFEVTADIGFYAYGNSLNEAFENASLAIFNIISSTDNVEAEKQIEFEITSEDKVSLLYDYLEELLFYHEVEFMLFSQFSIQIQKNTEGYYDLRAVIAGEEIDWAKHDRKCEIKAITFHRMAVNVKDTVELRAIVDL